MRKKKQITAYRVGGTPFEIRPAPHTREWMDNTHQKFAYRCLPLVTANCYGWELLCPETFTATWNGKDGLGAIDIVPRVNFVVSHFGYGILTFHIPYLFRTGKEADLLVSGPINYFWGMDAIPLEGIVETSWSPMTFTMNWLLTAINGAVTFEKGFPICRIAPVARRFLDNYEATVIEYQHIPEEILTAHDEWSKSRRTFQEQLNAGDTETVKKGWQKTYYKQAKLTKLPQFKTPCSQPSL